MSALPGIGLATADRVIAKLRRKMSKFALLIAKEVKYEAEVKRDVVEEAYEALRALGHSEHDARKALDTVLKAKRKFSDVEAVQQQIVDIVRRLEDAGEITVHAGEQNEQMIQ